MSRPHRSCGTSFGVTLTITGSRAELKAFRNKCKKQKFMLDELMKPGYDEIANLWTEMVCVYMLDREVQS